jgi:hypothetical protein
MPIKRDILGTPDPDEPTPGQLSMDEPETTQEPSTADSEPAKRKRRTKAEMIADAVVPETEDMIEVKDSSTGAKVQRLWHEAVELVKSEKAEFVNKELKYALAKFEQQQQAALALAQPSDDPAERDVRYARNGEALLKTGEANDVVSYSDEQGSGTMTADEWNLLSMTPPPADATPSNVPPDAKLGDEVVVGAETMRVGHGGVLTTSPVAVDGEVVKPKRRWQRELGSGSNGPWQSKIVGGNVPARVEAAASSEVPAQNGKGDDSQPDVIAQAVRSGEPVVQAERQPVTYEQVSPVEWKIGTGVLEKIGLPDYSSLQIGPITASRSVIDDGHRTTVTIGNREAVIPTVAVEIGQVASDIVEYIARYQRGELVSFLESTGALKQPVS